MHIGGLLTSTNNKKLWGGGGGVNPPNGPKPLAGSATAMAGKDGTVFDNNWPPS